MPASSDPQLVADRFAVRRQIGSGGMATVWLARDLRLERDVALKRLHSQLAAAAGAAERFMREALAAAALSHPHVVAVYDAGEDAQGPYLVMEYVEGETLADRLRREGLLPLADALRIAVACARALDHAHRRGVVHRDVKPGNVLLGVDGSVKLADFGIAKVAWEGEPLTQTASLVGTAAYLAPERVQGEESTPSSDVYALGVVLYEMLTGRPPFEGETPLATALAHVNQQPIPPGQLRELPPPVEEAVMRCLAKDPQHRFADAGALAEALGKVDVGEASAEGALDDTATQLLPAAATRVMPRPTMPPVSDAGLTRRLHPPASQPPLRRPSPLRWAPELVGLALLMVAALLAWILGRGSGDLPREAAPTTVATTAPTTVPATAAPTTAPTAPTPTTVPAPPATPTPEDLLAALVAEIDRLAAGREVWPPLKRDLEERLAEIVRRWEQGGETDELRERLEDLRERVEEGVEEDRLFADAGGRLLAAVEQTLGRLQGDDGDD